MGEEGGEGRKMKKGLMEPRSEATTLPGVHRGMCVRSGVGWGGGKGTKHRPQTNLTVVGREKKKGSKTKKNGLVPKNQLSYVRPTLITGLSAEVFL